MYFTCTKIICITLFFIYIYTTFLFRFSLGLCQSIFPIAYPAYTRKTSTKGLKSDHISIFTVMPSAVGFSSADVLEIT